MIIAAADSAASADVRRTRASRVDAALPGM